MATTEPRKMGKSTSRLTLLIRYILNGPRETARQLSDVSRIGYTRFIKALREPTFGFPPTSTPRARLSTSLPAPRSGLETLIREISGPREDVGIPELKVRTTYSWNWANIAVPIANAFWHGWADGSAGRAKVSDEFESYIINFGCMYNKRLYEFGLLLGEHGVNARDAMAHLVELCNDEATQREKDNSW